MYANHFADFGVASTDFYQLMQIGNWKHVKAGDKLVEAGQQLSKVRKARAASLARCRAHGVATRQSTATRGPARLAPHRSSWCTPAPPMW